MILFSSFFSLSVSCFSVQNSTGMKSCLNREEISPKFSLLKTVLSTKSAACQGGFSSPGEPMPQILVVLLKFLFVVKVALDFSATGSRHIKLDIA